MSQHERSSYIPRGTPPHVDQRFHQGERPADGFKEPFHQGFDGGTVAYAEHAVVAAVLGDPDGNAWRTCSNLPSDAFTDGNCRAIWQALLDGVPAQDPFALARLSGVSLDSIFSIGRTDRAGALLTSSRVTVLGAYHRRRIGKLGQRLAETPDADVRLFQAEFERLVQETDFTPPEAKLRARINSRTFNLTVRPAKP